MTLTAYQNMPVRVRDQAFGMRAFIVMLHNAKAIYDRFCVEHRWFNGAHSLRVGAAAFATVHGNAGSGPTVISNVVYNLSSATQTDYGLYRFDWNDYLPICGCALASVSQKFTTPAFAVRWCSVQHNGLFTMVQVNDGKNAYQLLSSEYLSVAVFAHA
jgi:hypothetical protein